MSDFPTGESVDETAAPAEPTAAADPAAPAVPAFVEPAPVADDAAASQTPATAAPSVVEAPQADDRGPVSPLPLGPEPHGAAPRFTGTAIAIALAGVLASGVVGGAAGYFGSRLAVQNPGSSTPTTSQLISNAGTEPVAAAAAIAVPSVVNIDVTSGTSSSLVPTGHPDVPSGGTGSGVAYRAAPDGGTYIITNNHVVAGATTIVVTPPGGDTISAKLIGTDPETDIAVIEVPAKLHLIQVADSDQLVVGQTVVAIGSPFGLEHSVSSGVVSAVHRSITGSTTDYSLVDAIQTDAAVNPGNSGGALVDRQGRLVGINSAIYTDSGNNAGVGFAIPSRTATRIADELIASGKATHAFLGIEGSTVTASEASAAGVPQAEGAIVSRVFADTGAAKAGLKKGDVIVALDNSPIRTMNDLILAVRRHSIGDTVALTLWRDHAKITLEMTVGDKPANLN